MALTAAEVALADELITQAAAFWQSFEKQKNAGTLTLEDINAAASKLDTDIAQLAADIDAKS